MVILARVGDALAMLERYLDLDSADDRLAFAEEWVERMDHLASSIAYDRDSAAGLVAWVRGPANDEVVAVSDRIRRKPVWRWPHTNSVRKLLLRARRDSDPVSIFSAAPGQGPADLAVVVLRSPEVVEMFRLWAIRNRILTEGKPIADEVAP